MRSEYRVIVDFENDVRIEYDQVLGHYFSPANHPGYLLVEMRTGHALCKLDRVDAIEVDQS